MLDFFIKLFVERKIFNDVSGSKQLKFEYLVLVFVENVNGVLNKRRDM